MLILLTLLFWLVQRWLQLGTLNIDMPGILTLVLQIILQMIEDLFLKSVGWPLLLVYAWAMTRSFGLMKRALLIFKLATMDPILGISLLQMFSIQKTLEQTSYPHENLDLVVVLPSLCLLIKAPRY